MKLNIHHVLMNFKKKLFFSRREGSVLNTNFLVCRFQTASQEETRSAPAFREGYIRELFGSAFEGVWRQQRARQETDGDRSPAGKGPARGCTLRNTNTLRGRLSVVDDNQKAVGALSVVGETKMSKWLHRSTKKKNL